jgi:hypothetical protein
MSSVLSSLAPDGSSISPSEARALIAQACPAKDYKGKRVLLIVPDATRTCPLGLLFKGLHEQIGGVTAALDVMIALGTHQPMSDAAICERLDITLAERQAAYRSVRFFNHEWDNPEALCKVGELTKEDTRALTDGLLEMDVVVTVNKRIFEYDQIIIAGPVFPHEVVGFSGGNKYLFPGVSGPEVLNFFHWLGAVVTNPMIIGNGARRSLHRLTRGGLGSGQRAFEEAPHHLQETSLPHRALLCAEDVRRALGRREMHVQARARGRRWRRTDHLRATHS